MVLCWCCCRRRQEKELGKSIVTVIRTWASTRQRSSDLNAAHLLLLRDSSSAKDTAYEEKQDLSTYDDSDKPEHRQIRWKGTESLGALHP